MRLRLLSSLLMLAMLAMPSCGQKTAEEFIDEGIALGEQGKYNEALQAYDKAIQLNPSLALAWISKGDALMMLERCCEAAVAFSAGAELLAGGVASVAEDELNTEQSSVPMAPFPRGAQAISLQPPESSQESSFPSVPEILTTTPEFWSDPLPPNYNLRWIYSPGNIEFALRYKPPGPNYNITISFIDGALAGIKWEEYQIPVMTMTPQGLKQVGYYPKELGTGWS